MSISYNLGIPAAGNNPSSDQPNMQTNTNSNSTIWGIDHYIFSNGNAGKHQKISLPLQVVPGAQTDPASAIYSNAGTASAVSELFYRSQNGIFLINAIKAFGNFTTVIVDTDPVAFNNSMNCVSNKSTGGLGRIYTIVLTTGAVKSAHPIIIPFYDLVIANAAVGISYTWTAATNTLVFTLVNTQVSKDFSFIVIEI